MHQFSLSVVRNLRSLFCIWNVQKRMKILFNFFRGFARLRVQKHVLILGFFLTPANKRVLINGFLSTNHEWFSQFFKVFPPLYECIILIKGGIRGGQCTVKACGIGLTQIIRHLLNPSLPIFILIVGMTRLMCLSKWEFILVAWAELTEL